jgi:hypothetical protein
MISRSNCAKLSNMFKLRRPTEDFVSSCCVTATNRTPCLSNIPISRAKSSNERERPSTLYVTAASTPPASISASNRAERRPFHVADSETAIVVAFRQRRPAFMPLTGNVRFSRFALSIEIFEFLAQALVRTLSRIDRAPDRCACHHRLGGRLAAPKTTQPAPPDPIRKIRTLSSGCRRSDLAQGTVLALFEPVLQHLHHAELRRTSGVTPTSTCMARQLSRSFTLRARLASSPGTRRWRRFPPRRVPRRAPPCCGPSSSTARGSAAAS